MIPLLVLAILTVHNVEGGAIDLNADQIVTMHETREAGAKDKHFTDAVRCVIRTTDGKFITVIEPCDDIRKMIEQANR